MSIDVLSSGPDGFEALIGPEPVSEYNGWANWQTWAANLFANGDYGTEPDPTWAAQVREAAQAGPDAMRSLWVEVMGYALDALAEQRVPMALRLYAADLLTSSLDDIDWQELAEHHEED